VTAADIAGASALGATIKLIADSARGPEDRIGASVVPTVVPLADPMGRTNGVTNRIEVRAEPVGALAFVGPGAGGEATSSAVLGDVLAIARGVGSTWAGLPPAEAAARGVLGGPSEHAPDRGWFAIVPGDIGSVGRADEEVRTAAVPRGTAVLLRGIPLTAARSLFLAAGLPEDATILPADISRRA
jgi:hypothetical protein